MNKTKITKKAEGITLIALIITIVVLLILAVVTISSVQDRGIIQHTKNASDVWSEGEEKEKVNLASNGAFLTGKGEITQDNLTSELNSQFGAGKWTLVESTEEYFKIKINASNREYIIYINGKVEAKGRASLVSFDKTEIVANMKNQTSTTLNESIFLEEDGTTQWVWTTSNECVATISGEDDKTKTINFVGGGTATITATYGEHTATCTITLEGPITVREEDSIFTFSSYFNNSKTVIVSGLKEEHKTSEEGKKILIPHSVIRTSDGVSYPVTSIGFMAFENNTNIESLEIPNSITEILDSAFSGCSGLTGTLTIPDSVESIGESAFSNCSGFTGALTIPDSVKSIGEGAFSDCSGFTGTLEIPSSITVIESFTFDGCANLSTIIIPDSVTSMDTYSLPNTCQRYEISGNITSMNISIFDANNTHRSTVWIPGALSKPESWDDNWIANANTVEFIWGESMPRT